MIKVGITGSNGFIGWHLCQTLKLQVDSFELIEFNRNWFDNNLQLDNFISKCDIIVHLAGLNRHNEESTIYDTNVRLANKLVDAFNRTKFKGQVLFSSSTQEERKNVFGNSKKRSKSNIF